MAKASREKGARGEREVCALFQAAGFDCNRVPNSGGLRIKGDLYGELAGLHVEVKRCERLDIPKWLRQVREEAGADTPILCFRRSGEDWQGVVPLKWLIELLGHLDDWHTLEFGAVHQ